MKKILDQGIKTDRLYLRKFSLDDALDMFEFTRDAANWEYIARDAHKDISQAEDFIKRKIEEYDNPNDITWGIELMHEATNHLPKMIGTMRVYDIDFVAGECKISYIINAAFSGRGYVTESIQAIIAAAFNILELEKVYADIANGNYRSEKAAMRCGMTKLLDYVEVKEIKGQSVNMYRYFIERGSL